MSNEEQRPTGFLSREEVLILHAGHTQGRWLPARGGNIVTHDESKREVHLGSMVRDGDFAVALFAPELALTAHALYLDLELAEEKVRRYEAQREGSGGAVPILLGAAGVGGWLTVLAARSWSPRAVLALGVALTVLWLVLVVMDYRAVMAAREKRGKVQR